MKKSTSPHRFGQQDVQIKKHNIVSDGFFRVYEAHLRHKLFQGGWSAWLKREIVDRGHAVAVLPYDVKNDAFVLIEQFRVGGLPTPDQPFADGQAQQSPWLFECVAGMVGADEEKAAVAERELFEETGLVARRLEYAQSYLSSPGGLTERIYVYIADVDASEAASFGGLASEYEDIRIFTLPRAEAMALLAAEQIDNAATVIALQWLALHREQLIKKWQQPV